MWRTTGANHWLALYANLKESAKTLPVIVCQDCWLLPRSKNQSKFSDPHLRSGKWMVCVGHHSCSCQLHHRVPSLTSTLRQALTSPSSPTFDRRCLLRPPIARICGYHPMNRVTWVPPSDSEVRPPRRWVRRGILLCLHCASTVESTDTRVTGCEVSHSVPSLLPLQSHETLPPRYSSCDRIGSRLQLHPIMDTTVAMLTYILR